VLKNFVVTEKLGKDLRVLDFGYEFLFTAARTLPFDMPFSLRPDMCYIFVQMAFPVFHEFDADRRSVPMGCTGRVFHALRGKHSALQATSHHRLMRCPSSSAMAFPVAE
jgi:hypothetical protein